VQLQVAAHIITARPFRRESRVPVIHPTCASACGISKTPAMLLTAPLGTTRSCSCSMSGARSAMPTRSAKKAFSASRFCTRSRLVAKRGSVP
jgi:hypothetical protein